MDINRIGLIGYGKIGRALAAHARELGLEVAFAQDPVAQADDVKVVAGPDTELYEGVDLVIECATRGALAESLGLVLERTNLLCFSLTAFSNDALLAQAKEASQASGHSVFVPHGAILGLDGIRDGRQAIEEVSITTTKSPKSLGLDPADFSESAVVYEGSTRGACAAFPRNVNVHAAIALAGIGFDKTHSKVVADPSVSTNTHRIVVKGNGLAWDMSISSFAAGGVTGAYTPLSACGSLDRIVRMGKGFSFV